MRIYQRCHEENSYINIFIFKLLKKLIETLPKDNEFIGHLNTSSIEYNIYIVCFFYSYGYFSANPSLIINSLTLFPSINNSIILPYLPWMPWDCTVIFPYAYQAQLIKLSLTLNLFVFFFYFLCESQGHLWRIDVFFFLIKILNPTSIIAFTVSPSMTLTISKIL